MLYRSYRPGAAEMKYHSLPQISRNPLPQPAATSDALECRSTSRISTVGQPDFGQWVHANEYLSKLARYSTQEVHDEVATDNDIGPKLLYPPTIPAAVWGTAADCNRNPWQPGLWVRFPVSGIAALVGAVLCMILKTLSPIRARG